MSIQEMPGWQKKFEHIPDLSWDVVIVGGGPSGTTAATHLSRKKWKVLLLEKAVYPREKVCGDGLIADSLKALERLGIGPNVRQKGFSSYKVEIWTQNRVKVDIAGDFITIKRRELDTLLAETAAMSGTCIAQATVNEVSAKRDTVCVSTKERRSARGRIAIVATGATGVLASHAEEPANAAAVRCYITTHKEHSDSLVVSYDKCVEPGYGWIFPMGQNEYNVGCIVFNRFVESHFNLKVMLQTFLDEFPLARAIRSDSKNITRPAGAPLRCGFNGVDPKGQGNVLFAGETVGTSFPFTGEGIGKAMESGEVAASIADKALRKNDFGVLEQYPLALTTLLKPKYLGYEMAERWLSHPRICNWLGRKAQENASLRETLAGILNEKKDPREVFSFKGAIGILLRK